MKLIDGKGRLLGRISLLDIAILLGGLSLSFLFLYSYRLIGHGGLAVYGVTPARVTTGIDRVITVFGTGFDLGSVVYIGNLPLMTRFLNEARLDATLPDEINQGKQEMYIRNGRGRFVMKADAFETIWKPEILQVEPNRLVAGEESRLVILGRHFEEGCTVTLGRLRLKEVMRLNPGRLEGAVTPRGMLPGRRYDLIVSNGKDRQTLLQNAVQILLRRPPVVPPWTLSPITPALAPITPAVRMPPTRITPAVVSFSFVDLDEKAVRMFQAGFVHLGKDDKPMGRVLGLQPIPKITLRFHSKRRTRIDRTAQAQGAMANLLLLGELQETEAGPKFFFKGDELHVGSQVSFRFLHPLRRDHLLNITGVALTEPVPQPDRTRDLIDSR